MKLVILSYNINASTFSMVRSAFTIPLQSLFLHLSLINSPSLLSDCQLQWEYTYELLMVIEEGSSIAFRFLVAFTSPN